MKFTNRFAIRLLTKASAQWYDGIRPSVKILKSQKLFGVEVIHKHTRGIK